MAGLLATSSLGKDRSNVDLGGIAQLGERLHGMQEVIGSIPFTSTTEEEIKVFDPIV